MLGRRDRIESTKKKKCSASIFQGSKAVFLDEHATDTFKHRYYRVISMVQDSHLLCL